MSKRVNTRSAVVDRDIVPQSGRDDAIVNFFSVALRSRTTKIHIWLTYGLALVLASYVSLTWNQPHRLVLLGLVAGFVFLALLVSLLPSDLLLHSRGRDVALLLWSFAELSLIGGMSSLDGGVRSPLTLMFFVPLVLSALSAPVLQVLAIGVMELLIYLGLVIDLGGTSDPGLMLFALALGLTALAVAWLVHIFEDQQLELVEISRTDPLTRSLNRRGFSERLEGAIDDALRTSEPMALVVLDLDRFKQVNDTKGHAAGDEVLRWTVERLRTVVRPIDSIGRLGGDEFALVLPRCGREQALAVMTRVRTALGDRAPASIGVACYPVDGLTATALQRHADDELYTAKRVREDLSELRSHELGWAAVIASAVDARIAGQNVHSNAVAQVADGIARQLAVSRHDLARLRIAGMLHDIGNVLLPDEILLKPGPLTHEERVEIQRSRLAGTELLGRISGISPVAEWIRHCHEHIDGSGYPDGLRGEEIPLPSRILLVADAYEAMISERPYRPAMAREDALAALDRESGRQFDAACVEALKRFLEEDVRPTRGPETSPDGGARAFDEERIEPSVVGLSTT